MSEVIDERLYNYSAGGFCGVLMPEKVMKKIAKINAEYSREVRRILNDNKEFLYASDWTMAYEEGKPAAYVYYTKEGEDVQHRIDLFKAAKPEYRGEVYLVKDREQAEQIADAMIERSFHEGDE
jgi:hypothetical protein